MVAEGLAHAYVHLLNDSETYGPSLCQTSTSTSNITSVILPGLSALTLSLGNAAPRGAAAKVHALAILHELHELRLPFSPIDEDHPTTIPFSSTPQTVKKIQGLAERWFTSLALTSPGGFEDAIEQLAWTAAAVYGVGGWDLPDKGEFTADFFL